jgi:hypothetical protein
MTVKKNKKQHHHTTIFLIKTLLLFVAWWGLIEILELFEWNEKYRNTANKVIYYFILAGFVYFLIEWRNKFKINN